MTTLADVALVLLWALVLMGLMWWMSRNEKARNGKP